MTYSTIQDLFGRLSSHSEIKVTPHQFRHSHATDLIREGMSMAYVQKRLGHASIQTTVDTYVHVSSADMKQAYQAYLRERDGANEIDIAAASDSDSETGNRC